MMFRNVKLLGWLVIILLATNLATVLTVVYHTKTEVASEIKPQTESEVPGDQRTHFFKDRLNLTDEQLEPFRDANHRYNREARGITDLMSELRRELLTELMRESASEEKLQQLSHEIGEQHEALKMATCKFYLDLKEICTPEQQIELAGIFQSLLNSDEKVKLPGKQYRRGRNSK